MTGKVVPIGMGPRRLPQAGRIRIGEKGGAQGRRSINVFRFTTQDPDLLAPLAELYGGEVRPWRDPKSSDTHELRSRASKINVVLPPEPLTESYELWSGKVGLERRCNGYTVAIQRGHGDDATVVEEDCLCDRTGVFECKYKLRISVILPEVESLGVWRLDTSSDNARKEVPAMIETIEALQERGLTRAILRLEQRSAPGKRFNVPVLDPGVSLDALGAGASRVRQLGSSAAQPHELSSGGGVAGDVSPKGSPAPPPVADASERDDYPMGGPDDEIVDAELIEDVDPTIAAAWLDNLPGKDRSRVLGRARLMSEEAGLPLPTSAAAIDPSILSVIAAEELP